MELDFIELKSVIINIKIVLLFITSFISSVCGPVHKYQIGFFFFGACKMMIAPPSCNEDNALDFGK